MQTDVVRLLYEFRPVTLALDTYRCVHASIEGRRVYRGTWNAVIGIGLAASTGCYQYTP